MTKSSPLFLRNQKKVTNDMYDALEKIRSSLLCQLCGNMMNDPSTLHCDHSFCLSCISRYDSWQCPVCSLPISMRGSNRSYIGINPQVSSVLTSFNAILSSIDLLKEGWWKDTNDSVRGGDRLSSSPIKSPIAAAPDEEDENFINLQAVVEDNASLDDIGCYHLSSSPIKSPIAAVTDEKDENLQAVVEDNERNNGNGGDHLSSSPIISPNIVERKEKNANFIDLQNYDNETKNVSARDHLSSSPINSQKPAAPEEEDENYYDLQSVEEDNARKNDSGDDHLSSFQNTPHEEEDENFIDLQAVVEDNAKNDDSGCDHLSSSLINSPKASAPDEEDENFIDLQAVVQNNARKDDICHKDTEERRWKEAMSKLSHDDDINEQTLLNGVANPTLRQEHEGFADLRSTVKDTTIWGKKGKLKRSREEDVSMRSMNAVAMKPQTQTYSDTDVQESKTKMQKRSESMDLKCQLRNQAHSDRLQEDNKDSKNNATQLNFNHKVGKSGTPQDHSFVDEFLSQKSNDRHCLNHSCAIPPSCPDVSPIAKVNSQSQSPHFSLLSQRDLRTQHNAYLKRTPNSSKLTGCSENDSKQLNEGIKKKSDNHRETVISEPPDNNHQMNMNFEFNAQLVDDSQEWATQGNCVLVLRRGILAFKIQKGKLVERTENTMSCRRQGPKTSARFPNKLHSVLLNPTSSNESSDEKERSTGWSKSMWPLSSEQHTMKPLMPPPKLINFRNFNRLNNTMEVNDNQNNCSHCSAKETVQKEKNAHNKRYKSVVDEAIKKEKENERLIKEKDRNRRDRIKLRLELLRNKTEHTAEDKEFIKKCEETRKRNNEMSRLCHRNRRDRIKLRLELLRNKTEHTAEDKEFIKKCEETRKRHNERKKLSNKRRKEKYYKLRRMRKSDLTEEEEYFCMQYLSNLLKHRRRGRRRTLIKKKNLQSTSTGNTTLFLLGCTVDEWITYLLKRYNEEFQTEYETIGELEASLDKDGFHIDEIQPCSQWDHSDCWEQVFCWNWRNSQILPAILNIEKKSKIILSLHELEDMKRQIKEFWSNNKEAARELVKRTKKTHKFVQDRLNEDIVCSNECWIEWYEEMHGKYVETK